MSTDINGITGLCVGRRLLQEKVLERLLSLSRYRSLRISDIIGSEPGEKYVIAGVIDQQRHSEIPTMKHFMITDISAGASVQLRLPIDIIKQELKVGYIIILLNPEITKNATGSAVNYISVSNQLNLLIVGEAAHFGRCNALRKDNTPCKMAIDTSCTTRCRYHKHLPVSANTSSAMSLLPSRDEERKPKIITEPVIVAPKSHHQTSNNSRMPGQREDLLGILTPSSTSSAATSTLQHVSFVATDGRVPVPKPSRVFSSGTSRPIIPQARPTMTPLGRNSNISQDRQVPLSASTSTMICSGGVIFDIAKTRANARPTVPATKRPAPTTPLQTEIDALLSRTSSHAAEADEEWHTQFSKKLKSLQHKEAVAEEKSRIEALHVNAFYCSECKRTSEMVIGYCRQHGHNVRQVRTLKRYFQCLVCNRSDWFLIGASKLPLDPCRTCNSHNWKTCGINAAAQSASERSTADEKLVLTMSEGTSRKDAARVKTISANLDRSAI